MVRKKSKFRHISISNKKYYFYRICWIDPCGDSGHAEASEVKELKPAKMISQAYIFAKDKKISSYSASNFKEFNDHLDSLGMDKNP